MEGQDVDYIWQRRIHSGMKWKVEHTGRYHQKSAVPFPDCAAIGLDFNVASKRKEKLDLDLMTNGVVLDICDFARTITRSQRIFICEILEYNFDLSFENDSHRCEFAKDVLRRVKEMYKEKPRYKPLVQQEAFVLPDPKTLAVNSGYYGQLQEMSEPSGMSAEGSKKVDVNLTSSESVNAENPAPIENPALPDNPTPSQNPAHPEKPTPLDNLAPSQNPALPYNPTPPQNPAPSDNLDPTDNPAPSDNPTPFDSVKAGPNEELTGELILHKRTHKRKGDKLKISDLYQCQNIGLDLVMRSKGKPKQKLSQDVLTKGMMVEIIDFVTLLCGNQIRIIVEVLEHNFDVDMHIGSYAFNRLRPFIHMKCCGEEFRKEHFSLQKRKWESTCSVAATLETKRRPKINLREDSALSQKETLSYMFPETTVSELKGVMEGLDVEYIWQRRINSGMRYQKSAVPFPDCAAIGLDFNVASKRKEKLDLDLLTNGVIVDIGEFANVVNLSEIHFISDILEFNFDLGIKDEAQHYRFSNHIRVKLLELKEKKTIDEPESLQDSFVLLDPKWTTMSSSSTSCSRTLEPAQHLKTSDTRSCDRNLQTGEQTELLESLYPLCKEIGLDLDIRPKGKPKPKLNADLLTKGVMMEVADFTKLLRGTFHDIVFDVLDHNFDLDLRSERAKQHEAMAKIKMILRKKKNLSGGLKRVRDAFCKETVSFEQKIPKKRKKEEACKASKHQRLSTSTRRPSDQRNRQEETPQSDQENQQEETPQSDQENQQEETPPQTGQENHVSYMCPVVSSSELSDSGDTQDDFKTASPEISCSSGVTMATQTESKSLHVKDEENDISISSKLPLVANHVSCNTTQEQVSDLFSEETDSDTETTGDHDDVGKQKMEQKKMWRRRAAYAKRILSKPFKRNDPYIRCRNMGLDFNVGASRKLGLDLQLMTYGVLREIYAFAKLLAKTQFFITEILENNFNIHFDNENHRNTCAWQIWSKIKMSQFEQNLTEVFKLPTVVKMDYSDSSPGLLVTEEASMEAYPFCREIGLNLHAGEQRQINQKLSLHLLTNGVISEVASFAKELAASQWQIIYEILEHNFDLNLQSGKTELAQNIQNNFVSVSNRCPKRPRDQWINMVYPIQAPVKKYLRKERQNPPRSESNRLREVIKMRRLDMETKRERSIVANAAKPCSDNRIKKKPSFPLCKQIGLELNVNDESKARTKLDLCLLTNSVMYEIHRFVHNIVNVKTSKHRYTLILYDILDHNFDLSSFNYSRDRNISFYHAMRLKELVVKRKNMNPHSVFNLPFKPPSKKVKRYDSHSTENSTDGDSLDWQRQPSCLTQRQPDQRCWNMETESHPLRPMKVCGEAMNTSVKKEEVIFAGQNTPQENSWNAGGQAWSLPQQIKPEPDDTGYLGGGPIKPDPDDTAYWGVRPIKPNHDNTTYWDGGPIKPNHDNTTYWDGGPIKPNHDNTTYWDGGSASEPQRQVDICRTLINDIVRSEGTTPQRDIFYRLENVFTDGDIGPEKNFKQILSRYKCEILPEFVKDCKNLCPSDKLKVSQVNELLCGLNLMSGLAHQSKTTLALWEKMISGEPKVAVHMITGIPELLSGTELLVNNLSYVARKQLCTTDGKRVDFRSFLTNGGEFEDVPLTLTREDTVDGLFRDAAGVYSICDDLVEFSRYHVNDDASLAAVASGLEVQHLKAGCRALGLVSKLIMDPLWKTLTSRGNLMEMEVRYQTLISKLIEWQEDGRDLVEGSECLFDDVEVQKDVVFDRLTMRTDSEFFELTVQIVEVMLASFLEVCCKMLVSGSDQDSGMHISCSKHSGIIKHLQEAKVRDVSIAFDSMSTFKEKRKWEWLQTLEQKQLLIHRELHCSVMQQLTIQHEVGTRRTRNQLE